MPLVGSPMLLTTLSTRAAGMIARTSRSTLVVRSVVSSMRVPVGARRWILMAAASTEGKKSWPSVGARPSDTKQTTRKPPANSPRWSSARASRPR